MGNNKNFSCVGKRVCILTSVHAPTDSRIYQHQATTLAEAGYQVTIVAPNTQTYQPSSGTDIIGIPKTGWRLGRIINWFHFIKIALTRQADIYHFHDPDLLLVGWLLRLFTGQPVIYDRHENYQEDILYKEWIPKPLRWVVSAVFARLEKFVAAQLSAVIVTVDDHLVYFANGVTVHNYPNLDHFLELPSLPRDPYKLVYTGSIGETYGIQTLIAMLALLKNSPVYLALFGTYRENDAEDKVRDLLNHYKVEDKYRFQGYIPYKQVREQLVSAQAGFIALQNIPAYYTLYPRKMFEYMACGLPVIASNLRALGQIISDADCGILVEPDNPTAFAEAVQFLLEHPAEARRLGENGRRAVMEKYNWHSEAEKLLDLYHTLLAESQ